MVWKKCIVFWLACPPSSDAPSAQDAEIRSGSSDGQCNRGSAYLLWRLLQPTATLRPVSKRSDVSETAMTSRRICSRKRAFRRARRRAEQHGGTFYRGTFHTLASLQGLAGTETVTRQPGPTSFAGRRKTSASSPGHDLQRWAVWLSTAARVLHMGSNCPSTHRLDYIPGNTLV